MGQFKKVCLRMRFILLIWLVIAMGQEGDSSPKFFLLHMQPSSESDQKDVKFNRQIRPTPSAPKDDDDDDDDDDQKKKKPGIHDILQKDELNRNKNLEEELKDCLLLEYSQDCNSVTPGCKPIGCVMKARLDNTIPRGRK